MSSRRDRVEEIAAQLDALPGRLRRLLAEPFVVPRGLADGRCLRITGVGSSAGHARFLVDQLQRAGLPARWTPLSSFASGPPGRPAEESLVLFSQGLSPNARLALADAPAWRSCAVVGATANLSAERSAFLDERGVARIDTGAGTERGALVRLVGPILAYVAALRLSASLTGEWLPLEATPDAIEGALEASGRRFRGLRAETFEGPFWIFSSGCDPITRDNLRLKLSEGLLRATAPVEDLLAFGHGPFQNLVERNGTIFLLVEPRDPGGDELRGRLGRLLESGHVAVPLEARLADPLSILEHEAALGAFVVQGWRARDADPADWPGQGADAALYELDTPVAEPPQAESAPLRARSLATLHWPELEARLERGAATAVIGLGSTEQHGPHMPFATDTWIAEALVERVCARVPDAIGLPALPFGCASEHMAFAGTLDLDAATFEALLDDLIRSVRSHGFRRVFVFSAHGGNVAALRGLTPQLAKRHAPLEVLTFTDHAALQRAWIEIAAEAGITAEAAGHHAGEIEASILAAIAPGALRREDAGPGFVESEPDLRTLFYPSLRERAPTGTVGDPSSASAKRGAAYLDAWVDRLVVACRSEDPPRS